MAFALISQACAGYTGSIAVQAGPIDTTGANLIVFYATADVTQNITVSDSQSNTWTLISGISNGIVKSNLYYCYNPSTSTSHTFQATGGRTSTHYPSLAVMAFSGSAANPLDQFSAAAASQPGSVTPTQPNELIVTCASLPAGANITPTVDSGFTLSQTVLNNANSFGLAQAYLIQTAAMAENPSWGTATIETSTQACFVAASVNSAYWGWVTS